MQRNNRNRYAGKSWSEKEAYKNFLSSSLYLDKTEDDPIDINKTNESSFKEEEIDTPKIKKKSKSLKIKDFLYDNWIIALISGIIFLMLAGYISMYREQGIQGEKVSTLENNVNQLGDLKNNFIIFKTEVSTELEFIKKKLNL